MNFNSEGVNPANNNNRFNGFSVRAVQHLPYDESQRMMTMNTNAKIVWHID